MESPETRADVEAAPPAPARRGGGRRRRRVIGAVGLVAVAAAVTGATFAAGLWKGELRQTLCGLPRAHDTPLGLLLPKDRPAVEQRTVSSDAMGGHGKLTCDISVDGRQLVHVLIYSQDPDRPTGTSNTAPGVRQLIDQGVVTGVGSASVVGYCPDTRDLAALATVLSDPALRPGPPGDEEPGRRALADLAGAVLAGQRQEICH
ncbi:hypothetical protein [Kitasatospora sp. NPDC047058]|uniref:hypothetical protein n=1 Tax=Kitasatospora sp. NPDC047058 TaxID=3155620 RepID=UPI0034040EE0